MLQKSSMDIIIIIIIIIIIVIIMHNRYVSNLNVATCIS